MSGAAVFVYHDFVDDPAMLARVPAAHRPYVLTRARLATHLAALAAADCRPCGLAEVVEAPRAGACVLTFDDGCRSDYETAFPLLGERGWRGCFFVIAGSVGAPGHVGWRELREMADGGMEIGSHSLTHPFLHQLDPDEVRREFAESKRMLEDGLGRPVILASLPRGSAWPGTGALIAELGYRAFCTSEPGLVSAATDPFAVPRVAVKHRTSARFLTRVAAGHPITLARLRLGHQVKRRAARMVGAERWRRLRGAIVAATGRVRSSVALQPGTAHEQAGAAVRKA